MKFADNINKGINILTEALKSLTRSNTDLHVFGCSAPQNSIDIEIPVRYEGIIHDDAALCVLYNAADVLVVPSLQENLSNVIMEALACGTPVVGFNIGGNSDMIEHQHNGYMARPHDPADLARGMEWVLN